MDTGARRGKRPFRVKATPGMYWTLRKKTRSGNGCRALQKTESDNREVRLNLSPKGKVPESTPKEPVLVMG